MTNLAADFRFFFNLLNSFYLKGFQVLDEYSRDDADQGEILFFQ